MVRYLSWPAVSWNRGGKNAINYAEKTNWLAWTFELIMASFYDTIKKHHEFTQVPSILMAFSDKMKIQLHTKEATAGRWSIRGEEENLFSKKFPIGWIDFILQKCSSFLTVLCAFLTRFRYFVHTMYHLQ